ncbi:MAG TPA: hypothetical protein VM325_03635 [Alphaproteobacteria bacterium]|nr:hypothetical protein [Alphaproteobacteria bacterium]
MVNAVVVFASIHFYTHWFEHLRAWPFSVIVGGALSIVIAFALWHYNQKARPSLPDVAVAAPDSAQSTGTV